MENKLYTCPMHPEVSKNHSGMCPECGMQLLEETKPIHKEEGTKEHDKHQGHKTNIFKRKFWVSLILTIPILAYSEFFQELLNFTPPTFGISPLPKYIPLVLGSIIFFYGGWVFISSAYRELKAKLPGMMTLISLAILTAYIYSIYVTFTGSDKTLFWELSTLITVMLLGHWMEMRAVSGAQSALKELSKLIPDKAEVIRNGETKIIPIEELKNNDIVLIKPGSKIPADGIVIEGSSEVNEAIVTGESRPVTKEKDSEVIAGTINSDGSLKIKVTKIGEETFLAGVKKLVEEAQASKSKLQILSDKAAYYLTLIAIITGGITLAFWLFAENATFAIERMVSVLVITCPHALGLAIPLVASISTTKAANNGFLVKQRLALESARNINIVLFDKTGTLTEGKFGVDKIIPIEENNEEKVLQYSSSVNASSEHPLALAQVMEAKKKNIQVLESKDFGRIPGLGVKANIDNVEIIIGSRKLAEEKSEIPNKLKTETEELEKQGKTINFVIVDNKIIGAIALSDKIREESYEAIKELKDSGIETAMITGDSEDVAKFVASELGIDKYFASVLPKEKSEKVKLLQKENKKVAMVGDGVNDAPALAQADLGIAIGAGTNVAIESAGIILVKNDPRDIPKIIKLSNLTYTKMIQNLFWATGYNVIAIPLAAGVFAFAGIFLQPALAALFMSISTVIVAINAILLKNKKM